MANKAKKDENSRPLILNLIAIIGCAFFFAFIMRPDIKDQVYYMRNYGVGGYALVITCFFCFVLLIILFCFLDF